jgi:hypothetical protein
MFMKPILEAAHRRGLRPVKRGSGTACARAVLLR